MTIQDLYELAISYSEQNELHIYDAFADVLEENASYWGIEDLDSEFPNDALLTLRDPYGNSYTLCVDLNGNASLLNEKGVKCAWEKILTQR